MPMILSRLSGLRRFVTTNNAVLAIALFIALGWIWGSVDALGRNYKYQQRVDAERAGIELLSLQNDTLKAEQNYLQSDEYLELAARSKLNKAMPGEKLVVLPAVTKGDSSVSGPTASPVESNFAQWVGFLLGTRRG